MKFKYYLRGCGLGILVATFVFIIAIHARGGIMSDDKAMERASELGMILPETQTEQLTQVTQETEIPVKETTSPDTQKTTQAEDKKHLIQSTQDTQKSTETEKDTQKDTKKDTEKTDTSKDNRKDTKDDKKDNKSDTQKSTQETQTQDEEITFTVKSGEVCRVIAENLQAKGLVKDAEEFRKYMKDHNYANSIRVGTFKLKKGMSYAEIAKVLTKR